MSLRVKKVGEGHQHPASETLMDTVTREDTVRLNVNVPRSFYRQVRLFVATHDTTITNVVIAALQEYMSKHANE